MNNYNLWKFAMKMCLIQKDLWGCVERTETEAKSKGQEPRFCLTVKQMRTRICIQLRLPKKRGTVKKAYEDKGITRIEYNLCAFH
jgi:hypothetical protein